MRRTQSFKRRLQLPKSISYDTPLVKKSTTGIVYDIIKAAVLFYSDEVVDETQVRLNSKSRNTTHLYIVSGVYFVPPTYLFFPTQDRNLFYNPGFPVYIYPLFLFSDIHFFPMTYFFSQ